MAKLYPLKLSLFLSLISSASFQGCVMDATTQNNDNPKTQKITSSAKESNISPSGIPNGCSREWNSIKSDSVVVCSDPTPPQMK